MIFQSPRRVAFALRDNTLTEHDKLNSLWVVVAINSLFSQAGFLSSLQTIFSIYGLIQLLPLGVVIWGISASYRVNSRGDNQRFLERFFCLTAALSIRAYLAYFLGSILLQFLASMTPFLSLTYIVLLLQGLLGISITLYIYLRLQPLMAIAATVTPSQETIPS